VAHFALSAFGDPDALTVDGKDGATANACSPAWPR